MLLRQLTQHVTNQNWFAVFLDFFIVIAGILIAFQITNWNDLRLEQVQEQKVIERLHADFLELAREVDEKISFLESAENTLDEMEKFIVDFREGADAKHAHVFFETAFSLPSMAGQSATYSQLVSSGDMKLLSNDNLVVELVAHAALTQELGYVDQAVREFMRPYGAPIVRFSKLIDVLPLEKAFVDAGSRSDMIVAIGIYNDTIRGHLAMFKNHQESFSKLADRLKSEQNRF